jgi:hypothetical protein
MLRGGLRKGTFAVMENAIGGRMARLFESTRNEIGYEVDVIRAWSLKWSWSLRLWAFVENSFIRLVV